MRQIVVTARGVVLSSLLALLATVCAEAAWAGGAGGKIDIQPASVGQPHDFIYALSFEGQQGVAVGDHGLLLVTADGGGVWEKRRTPAARGQALFAVVRVAGKCIAAGQEGRIIRADDCARWEATPPVTAARLLGLAVNAQGVGYAVGGFGTILKTVDWGQTWAALEIDWPSLIGHDAEPHLYAAQLDAEGVVTIAGEFELIARSTDGGSHWTVLHQGARSLFGLAAGPDGRLFAVGQEGVILKSGDGGKSWSAPPSGTSAILTGVWADADGQSVVAVGVRAILISRDGGSSFAPAPAFASTAAGNVYSTAQGAGQPGAQQAVSIGGARGEILRLNF